MPFIIIILIFFNWHTSLFFYLTRSTFCCGFFKPFFSSSWFDLALFCHLVPSSSSSSSFFLIHPLHVCVSFFLFLLFPFLPKLLPFHSIGTREVVTQKNLCGLVPIRDFRLDPSLLYSIPLLALSPNLLVVWLFLSIAYLVARVRCKWRRVIKLKPNEVPEIFIATWYLLVKGMSHSIVCQELWLLLLCLTILCFYCTELVNTHQIILWKGIVLNA